MGHDIYGYKPTDKEMKNNISYLRRSAFDNNNREIYIALDIFKQYGGVSGMGGQKSFTVQDILTAIKKLAYKKENGREIKFLADILINLEEGEESAIILFS